ncbi:MAG: hypothetical protein GKR87_09490 [Kiritimatiellae bacterium]|nr:hypothetical protein [Kiritimatiellia bacterium]
MYGIHKWGKGYFDVSETGEVVLSIENTDPPCSVNMMDIVAGFQDRGLDMPVLLRCSNILASRIELIHTRFKKAIDKAGYKGTYQGVYPIKVNQQQHVVEEIIQCGARFHHGLEAGSKGELIATLAYVTDPKALIICNGYKDGEFVDLALYGQKMGLQTVLVLEMPSELPLILERAKKMEVQPLLGIRAKADDAGRRVLGKLGQ